MFKLFKSPRFTFGLLSQTVIYCAYTYLHPTLAIHLQSLGCSEIFIGLAFALPTVIYVLSSFFLSFLTTHIKKRGVILIGYLIVTISLIMIGPSLMLGRFDSPFIIFVGLCLMGSGCAIIIIPILPEMLEATEEANPELDQD